MNVAAHCCEANVGERMLGTAAVVDVWVLLEHRPAWRARAWEDNDLAAATRRWLNQGISELAAQGCKVRPQLIRQPPAERPGMRLLIHRDGVLRAFRAKAADYADLAATPLPALALGAGGERLEAPHYFVCVNGRRDRCCARFGLPVYRRLRELVGERAWQVTHLGGHRFAPNVLVLPQGALYGRVGAGGGGDAAVADFVDQVEAGGMPLAQLRGRACYPKAVQAAEGFAGEGLKFVAAEEDRSGTAVTFTRNGAPLRIKVAKAEDSVRVLASCGDERLTESRPYVLAG